MTIGEEIGLQSLLALLWLLLGYDLGVRRERRAEAARDEDRRQRREAQYTGQKCVDCRGEPCDVYPAVCDTCSVAWRADMDHPI